jgi:hypothetical protein
MLREPPVAEHDALAAQIASLERLSIAELRAFWRQHVKGDPPPLRGADLLGHEIAWRLQAQRYGDLDPALHRRLEGVARTPRPRAGRRAATPVGSTLIKVWDGERHSVVVTENGYLYRGQTYASLSAIARAITGVRWSGPRFFGLTA